MPGILDFEGQKKVPPEVKGWNWGAFFFTWIWGIFNGTLISLLSLIPGIHFIMMFVLGAKGNEWAWSNKNWESVEEFQRTQRKWAIGGLCFWLLLFFLFLVIPFGLLGWGAYTDMPQIKAMIADFDPHHKYCNYALGAAERESHCRSLLGAPLQFRGRGEYAVNENGYAEYSLPVRGPRGEGTIYLRAHKNANEEMQLERAELELKGLQRLKLDTAEVQRNMQATERKIVQLVQAIRAHSAWKQREPGGNAEAEEFYRDALKRIEAEPNVKKTLGSKISARIEKAQVIAHGPMGEAEFRVNLQGSEQSGQLLLKGRRSLGRWTITEADLEARGKTMHLQDLDGL